jgi:exopolyphosphatase/guanosine-5'-triphosphate,3'-diphosphate pyrophosphatase
VSVRVAVVDVGTNSTRLLVADVDGGVTEVERRSTVTRLGEGVDATGRLAEAAVARVERVLAEYREVIDACGAQRAVGVLTSAVRDASNGAELVAAVRERHGIDARMLSGAQEARLTYLGATSARAGAPEPLLVIDVGGGSTELVVGEAGTVRFHVSTQAGVGRQCERHLRGDPPEAGELAALRADVRRIFGDAVPHGVCAAPAAAVGVAGTATSLAAIDLALEPYDPARVEGHVLGRDRCEELLGELAAQPLEARRTVRGLHPDRAPTIVAGAVLLIEALRRFGLREVTVSEHDLLYGAALGAAA